MRKFIPIAFILVGIYWLAMSFTYGLWIRGGPGGGFLPALAGILMIIFGMIITISEFKNKIPSGFTYKAFLPPLVLFGIVIASKLFGLILTLVLYIFIWLKYYEKKSYLQSVSVAILCPTIIYLIFIMWLKVPLPKGILGIL